MKKRWTAAMLILSLLCLSACTAQTPQTTAAPTQAQTTAAATQAPTQAATQAPTAAAPAAETTAAATEAAKPGPVQTAPSDTKAEEPKGDVRPLHVWLTSKSYGKYEEGGYGTPVSITQADFELAEEDAAKYPKLDKALKDYHDRIEDGKVEIYSDLQANYQDLKEYRKGEELPQLTSEDKAFIVRADSRILSTLREVYAYYGGAHPEYYCYAQNFDTSSGKVLQLEDVVKDRAAFTELCLEKIRENYAEEYEYMIDPDVKIREGDYENEIAWTMGYEEMTVCFNSYVLGPYAMGRQVIRIAFSEAPELFNKAYTETAEDYVYSLSANTPYSVDLKGTGKPAELVITEESQDEYGYQEFILNCGGRELVMDDSVYYQESYLVRSGGRYYVYMFETSDNDYTCLTVVDLEKMETVEGSGKNQNLSEADSSYESDDEGYVSTYKEKAFTDTSLFEMSTRMDTFSSTSGIKNYRVGKKGVPVSDQPWYTVYGKRVLKTLAAVECELVDADGKVQRQIKVPEGTFLQMIRAEDMWVDFQEVDGAKVEVYEMGGGDYGYNLYNGTENEDPSKPYYRIYQDSTSYPYTVNGTPEDEVFDGIMYAG